MSNGQIVALIFAILLLLPGGCFLLSGIDDPGKSGKYSCDGCGMADYLVMLPIAAAILALAWYPVLGRFPPPA